MPRPRPIAHSKPKKPVSAAPGAAPATDSVRDWPSWTGETAVGITYPTSTHEIDCLAFALHSSELTNHYGLIWEQLDPRKFEIVYASEDPADNSRIAGYAAAHGYTAKYIGDVLRQGRKYKAVVSNHMGAAGSIGAELALPRLGRIHVRLMYSLGKDGWNFQEWNNFYDLILCYGPYQAGKLAEFEHPRVAQIGYPRFDRFFCMTESRRSVVARLGGNPDLPTLVWLPTWSLECSVPAFAETIASLRDEMNILIKVHPLTTMQEPDHMAALADAGLHAFENVDYDNVELFYAADIVAVDYGGSPFGAIYTDRDIVLLNTPEPADQGFTLSPKGSLDRRLREWMLNIDPGEGGRIRDYMRDSAARAQQREVRQRLRRSLFAPFDGCSAKAAALILSNIESACR